MKAFIADLARPFAIYATAVANGWASVVIAYKVTGSEGGALVLGATGLTLTGLYAGKVIENYRTAASNAEVEKVRAQASPPPAEALKPATDDGELPPEERVKL